VEATHRNGVKTTVIKPNALEGIRTADLWLDECVSPDYDTLAQHWARVAKTSEEIGEAIAQLILWTGQNPRKPRNPGAYDDMLSELADTALTGILAIQHFTKDTARTDGYLNAALTKIVGRAIDAGYVPQFPDPEPND
jgi:hypothetical protein